MAAPVEDLVNKRAISITVFVKIVRRIRKIGQAKSIMSSIHCWVFQLLPISLFTVISTWIYVCLYTKNDESTFYF